MTTPEETKAMLADRTTETHVEKIDRLLRDLADIPDTEVNNAHRLVLANEINMEQVLESAIQRSRHAQIQEKDLAAQDDTAAYRKAYLDEVKHVQAFRDRSEERLDRDTKAIEDIAEHLNVLVMRGSPNP